MAKPPTPACRLYAILARDGRSAVVFRRGPSRRVMLFRWWLDSDTIEPGQWLKGRSYERRCDLSPNGELLIYFAARWSGPIETWTAVSRPPYFTALALWPKGDAWGGGGLFLGPREIGLNHRDGNIELADGFTLPRGVKVKRYADYAGYGEDNPIEDVRLAQRLAPCSSCRRCPIRCIERLLVEVRHAGNPGSLVAESAQGRAPATPSPHHKGDR